MKLKQLFHRWSCVFQLKSDTLIRIASMKGIWLLLWLAFPFSVFATELIVMRHGQTDWNYEHILQGHTDTALNQVGVDQIKQSAKVFKGIHFDAVFASPLSRTRETAEILSQEANVPSAILDERLMSPFFGVSEGQKVSASMEQKMRQEHFDEIQGGESPVDFQNRVTDFLKEITLQYPAHKRVLVVTHSGVIRLLLRLATGQLNLAHSIPNGAIYRFYVAPDGTLTYLGEVDCKNGFFT